MNDGYEARWVGIVRVFISSTVFDLIDVRAELASCFRSLGIVAVLSDDKLSDFKVLPDESSIESCLVNVAACDEVVVVLDRRYGPRLGKFELADVSATHLEYLRAKELRLPIHVFVRDRLEADYNVWKRNKRSAELLLPWVGLGDFGLFTLLDEHSKLKKKHSSTNWYSTFSNSIDLKAAVSNRFAPKVLPARLVEAIGRNEFPLFDVELNVEQQTVGGRPGLNFSSKVRNVGGSPAFKCRFYWEGERKATDSLLVVTPGQSMSMTFIYGIAHSNNSVDKRLFVEYESAIGVSVIDCFRIHGHVHQNVIFSGGTLMDRRYKRCSPLTIDVDEV